MAEQVFPTKNNLMAAQKSLALAQTGYDLMDRKRNILVREIMKLSDDAKSLQDQISVKFTSAYYSLQTAHLTGGFSITAADSMPEDESLKIVNRSIMGVELPTVTIDKTAAYPHYGLTTTSESLDEAYEKFIEVKELTVKLAQVESSIIRLSDAIKRTRKRTNALGNIMIPKFKDRISFISSALEEKEREDFSRLKVIKKN